MATVVLQVPDESLVSKVKNACKTAHYKEAMDDVKNGRVYHANSVDDMFNQILG